MGITKKQKTTLKAIGRNAENFKLRGTKLGEPISNIDNRLTTLYESTLEHIEYLDEYYPVFEGRIRRNPERLKKLVLSINRKINKMEGI